MNALTLGYNYGWVIKNIELRDESKSLYYVAFWSKLVEHGRRFPVNLSVPLD